MPRDFYATVAQVLPVLLLALVWESRYLERLRSDKRDGVRFWTKPRIRAYSLMVATVILADTLACILLLAGAIRDSIAFRIVVVVGVFIALASLLFRIFVEIFDATRMAEDRSH